MKAAVASSDGIFVDRHLGRTDKIYIYEMTDSGYNLLEVRENGPAYGEDHQSALDKIVSLVEDADIVIAERVGGSAAELLFHRGIQVFQLDGKIGDILKAIEKSKRFQILKKRGWQHGRQEN